MTNQDKKSCSYISDWHLGFKGHSIFVLKTAREVQAKHGLKVLPRVPISHLVFNRELHTEYFFPYFAPIPNRTWRKMGGAAVWKALEADGIVEVRGYSHSPNGTGKCRSFRLTDSFYQAYHRAGMADMGGCQMYNIHTGKPSKRLAKTKLRNDNGDEFFADPRCQRALRILSETLCPINKEDIKKEIALMMEEVRYSRRDADHKRLSVAMKTAARMLTAAGSGDSYQPAHEVSQSGRLIELGGGAQGAPARIKWAAFQDMIERGEAFNYDMVCAQGKLLLKTLNAYNTTQRYLGRKGMACQPQIKVEALAKFCNDDSFRKGVFNNLEAAGCPGEYTKQIVYGIIMGMSVKENIWTKGEVEKPNGLSEYVKDKKIRNEIRRQLTWLTDIMKEANQMLARMIKATASQRWQKVADSNINMVRHLMSFTGNGIGVYVKNAAGMYLQVTNGIKKMEDVHYGKIWAHLLQGAEFKYIAELICLCDENGIKVYSYQYDGVITSKKIPAAIQKEAAKNAGLGIAAKLEIKPFKRTVKIDNKEHNSILPDGRVNTLLKLYDGLDEAVHQAKGEGLYTTRALMVKLINDADKTVKETTKVGNDHGNTEIPEECTRSHGDARGYRDEKDRGTGDLVVECTKSQSDDFGRSHQSDPDQQEKSNLRKRFKWEAEIIRYNEGLRASPGG